MNRETIWPKWIDLLLGAIGRESARWPLLLRVLVDKPLFVQRVDDGHTSPPEIIFVARENA
jgi:hypothetical protein